MVRTLLMAMMAAWAVEPVHASQGTAEMVVSLTIEAHPCTVQDSSGTGPVSATGIRVSCPSQQPWRVEATPASVTRTDRAEEPGRSSGLNLNPLAPGDPVMTVVW